MYVQHSNIDGFLRNMRGLTDPPKIPPRVDRRSAMISAVKQVCDRELTERQRTVVELCLFENMSVSEVAKMLNVNKSTVSRHLSAARTRIEQTLKYSCFNMFRD